MWARSAFLPTVARAVPPWYPRDRLLDFLDAQIATLNTTMAERRSALPPTETVAVPVAPDESSSRSRSARRCCSALAL